MPDERTLARLQPPEYLPEEGKVLWCLVVEQLGAELIVIDTPLLELMCRTYAAALEAVTDLNTRGVLLKGRTKDHSGDDEGEPYMVKNPAEQIARQMTTQFIQCAKEFGMSPAARKRMAMELKSKAKQRGPQPEID